MNILMPVFLIHSFAIFEKYITDSLLMIVDFDVANTLALYEFNRFRMFIKQFNRNNADILIRTLTFIQTILLSRFTLSINSCTAISQQAGAVSCFLFFFLHPANIQNGGCKTLLHSYQKYGIKELRINNS